MSNGFLVKLSLESYSVFLILTVLIDIFLFVYVLQRAIKIKRIQASRTFYSFAFFMTISTLWSTGQFYELLYGKQQTGIIFFMEYFAVCYATYSWMIFCLYFVNVKFIQKASNAILLAIPPTFFYLSVLTNDFHNMFTYFSEGMRIYGPIFKIHSVIFIIYWFIGCGVLISRLSKQKEMKIQLILLLFSFVLPIGFGTIKVLGIVRFDLIGSKVIRKDVDLSSVGFIITTLIFIISFFRYRLLNIAPFAYKEIFDNMKEAVAVVNENSKIHLMNQAFKKTFSKYSSSGKSNDFGMFIDYLKRITINADDNNNNLHLLEEDSFSITTTDIYMEDESREFYSVNINPLIYDEEYIGKIITFNNVTEFKTLLEEYNKKIIELSDKNKKLKLLNESIKETNSKLLEYSSQVEELSAMKERNRLTKDLQSTLNNSISLMIALLEAGKISIKENPDKAEVMIDKAMATAREGLKDIRLSLKGLISNPLKANDTHIQ